MSLRKKTTEIKRLVEAFDFEAKKFHDITFSTYTITQFTTSNLKFKSPNHAINLWQYYGKINEEHTSKELIKNLKTSDSQWGIRGAKISAFGLIEGNECNLFLKMARRAAHIFSKKEAEIISSKVVNEIRESESDGATKTIVSTNSNSLAIWLNYLLYYLSMTSHKYEGIRVIDIDPFALSLLALEQLLLEPTIKKVDKSLSKVDDIKFDVALSFPGEKRDYVSEVADILRENLDDDRLFYDFDYQSQLARPNTDILLQNIYRNNAKLIVVFLSKEYAQKEWCGLEWRSIRDIIKAKGDEQIMFVKFDDAQIDGLFSIDGYINANIFAPKNVADFIMERVKLLS
ncbi:MAG: TIR domain-containing protein [Candidatus Muirbacterium halophilum]|nr:TIR domain-containing protein [Candidatus Muirbacterium halophilum]